MDREPTITELIEARERMDAGLRLAFPQLIEDSGPDPEQRSELDHEQAKDVAGELLDIREGVVQMAKVLPLDGHMDLHLAFNGLLNEIDRIGGVLAERWRSS